MSAKRKRLYDDSCADLARSFLEDSEVKISEATVDELADRIQEAIEDFFYERENK